MFTPDSELDRAVGAVARAAASLEGLTLAVLCWLTNLSQAIGRVTLPDNMDRRLAAMKEVAPTVLSDESGPAEIRTWAGHAKAAYAERSLIVHSEWSLIEPEFLTRLRDDGGFPVADRHVAPGARVYSPFPRKRDFVRVEDFRSLDDMALAAANLSTIEHRLAEMWHELKERGGLRVSG